MKPRLFLFDLDGTILRARGVGREAFSEAFARLTGRSGLASAFDFRGQTDLAVARHGFEAAGLPFTEELARQLFEHYAEALAPRLNAACEALEGAASLLEHLQGEADVHLGIGTGNTRRGATLKLTAVGLQHHFAYGAFGDELEDRAALLALARERGAEQAHRPAHECVTLVIGDTPKDVFAARAIGAPCLAVACSGFPEEELRAAGADHAVASLSDPSVLPWLLER